ncbi:MAG: 50S ribosomal protein L34 [Planctomycetes bacterium]|nr:50S ribosomal protein L34 [Planctomycetota bacterium]
MENKRKSKIKKIRKSGFRARMKSRGGRKIGLVQFHIPQGNTFQAAAMATNNHNSLSKQELWRKW